MSAVGRGDGQCRQKQTGYIVGHFMRTSFLDEPVANNMFFADIRCVLFLLIVVHWYHGFDRGRLRARMCVSECDLTLCSFIMDI